LLVLAMLGLMLTGVARGEPAAGVRPGVGVQEIPAGEPSLLQGQTAGAQEPGAQDESGAEPASPAADQAAVAPEAALPQTSPAAAATDRWTTADTVRTGIIGILAVAAGLVVVRRQLWDPRRGASWPPDAPSLAVPDWPIMLLGALVVWFAQQIGAASARVILNLPPDAHTTLRGAGLISLGGYVGMAVGALFTLGMLPGVTRLVGADGVRASLLRDTRAGLGAFALVFPLVLAAGFVMVTIAGWIATASGEQPPQDIAHDTLRRLAQPGAMTGADALWWWLVVVCVVVGAPLAEELIYRGFFQGGVRRALVVRAPGGPPSLARRFAPVVIVSGLFASMHISVVEWHAVVTLFLLSVGFGVAFERTGRLTVPIVMHVAFNAANIALAMLPRVAAGPG
jgi:membrane protease YdiL (CAAX protease family)